MASVRAALRALALEHSAAQVLLEQLSHCMANDLHQGRFITMVLAILDSATHRVEFSNAGHGPTLHFSAVRNEFVPLEPTGVPLGVTDHPEYPTGPALVMDPGDMLVLCTDGIVEATDAENKQFGRARLEKMIRDRISAPVSQIVEDVGAAVSSYFQGDSPSDDLTILVARRNV